VGNSTQGYVRTPSLFYWMYDAFGGRSENFLDSEGAAGMIVPGVVLVLFWMKRRDLTALDLGVWSPGMLLVAAGVVVHLLGYWVQQPRFSVIGLFIGVYGLMGLAWGRSWLRASFFPFFLFVFCIPLGTLTLPITFQLRLLACRLCQEVCGMMGIYVVREGTTLMNVSYDIYGPHTGYPYYVEAACSGIRSLYATGALATVFAFLFFRTWWRRLVMVIAAVPLAVMGNVLRLVAIIVADKAFGREAGLKVHEGGPLSIYSLLPYVPAFAGLFVLEWWLREKPLPLKRKQATAAPLRNQEQTA